MTIIIAGALALNLTLPTVARTRLDPLATAYPVTHDLAEYECLLGVPGGYADLIDREADVALYDGRIVRALIVDVEADVHTGFMDLHGLAADTNCPELVHERGLVIVWGEERQ